MPFRGMNLDWGWRGVAGFLAIFNIGAVVAYVVWKRQLWCGLRCDVSFLQGAMFFLALLLCVVAAKLVSTCLHFCVVFWQVYKYKKLAKIVASEQNVNPEQKTLKVLICHASVGAGHKRAAEAISATIRVMDPTVDVRVVDIMEPPMADPTLIYFYKDWYLRLVGGETMFGSLGGHCIGFFFDRANSVNDEFTGGGFLTRRITQSFLLNFLEMIYETKPDIVVHTHFLAPQLLAALRRRHNLQLPHVTVVTDMDVHAWWYQQPTDHYFTPRELARHQLVSDGVPKTDVSVSGIPIMPQFRETLSALRPLGWAARRQRLLTATDVELNRSLFDTDDPITSRGRPLVVQMSTGRSALEIYRYLLEIETPIALIVVCGRQADVRSQLQRLPVPPRHRVSLVGFTRSIHELLGVADIVVTKPGGLITSEALACGVMMVIVDPYPGQEERNASMLLEESAGIWVWDYRDLRPKLDPILAAAPGSRTSLATYRENARRLGKPEAAFDVAKYVLSQAPRKRMLDDFAGDSFRPKFSSKIEDGSPVRDLPRQLHRMTTVDLERLSSEVCEDEEDEVEVFADSESEDNTSCDMDDDLESCRSPASRQHRKWRWLRGA